MSMQTEDLYDARKRIIQLEYDLAILKINIKYCLIWIPAAVIAFTSLCLLVLR